MATPLVVSEVAKSFTMHLRDGIRLPVVAGVSFALAGRANAPCSAARRAPARARS